MKNKKLLFEHNFTPRCYTNKHITILSECKDALNLALGYTFSTECKSVRVEIIYDNERYSGLLRHNRRRDKNSNIILLAFHKPLMTALGSKVKDCWKYKLFTTDEPKVFVLEC